MSSRFSVVKRQHDWKGFIYLCRECENPSKEGVIVEAFAAARGVVSYKIDNARLLFAIPNYGHFDLFRSDFLNESLIPDAIVVMNISAGVSIIEKARQVQRQKAAGLIVIESESGEQIRILSHHRFDTDDHWALWDKVQIPCILIRGNMKAKFFSHVNTFEEEEIKGPHSRQREQ